MWPNQSNQMPEREMKAWFYVVAGTLLLIQFAVYALVVRPYVGSIIDPHSVRRGYFELSDDAMLWIAIVSLSVAVVVYSAIFLTGIFWGRSESSKDKTLERLALINITMGLGQLVLVLT